MKYILKSFFRNFTRKPATNLINLFGLAVSLALVIILSVYCYSELTTDHFHKNGDRIYLCARSDEYIHTTLLLKDQIDLSVPSVELAVRVGSTWETPTFQAGDKDPIYSELLFADNGFFDLFSYKATSGYLESALKEPLTLVVTKPFAEKLFGTANAVGKTVRYNNDKLLTVKAVVEEPKGNSIISFNAVTSTDTKKIVQPNPDEFSGWGWTSSLTFVRLKEGVGPDLAAKNILSVIPKDEQLGYAGEKLIPLKNLYFMKLYSYVIHFGDKRKVMILLVVANLILMVALVNFINISSAQWLEKIRQTGVMKVIGAKRSTILRSVLSESFLFFMMALLISIVLALGSAPFISDYTGIHINTGLLLSPSFLLVSVAATFVLSMTFSLIPALRISSSNAVDNLKKSVSRHTSKSVSRAVLVTAQFTIAIVLVAFTVLVQKQVNFGSSNLGINQENIVGIKLTQQLSDKKDVLKQLLEESPYITSVSLSQYYPGKPIDHLIMDSEVKGKKSHSDFNTFCADAAFLKILGLQLVQGRFYSDDLSSDANKAVVNETFVREHKMENPLGEKIFTMNSEFEVIGVVKDFHYKPFNEPITPLAIRNEHVATYCLANLQTTDFRSLHNTLQKIKETAIQLSPSFPVEISFFDQAVEQMYQSELQFRRTFTLFAGSAIVICCMGILAMSLFAAHQRIKEIYPQSERR